MQSTLRFAIIGDFDPSFPPHTATSRAFAWGSPPSPPQWLPTPSLENATAADGVLAAYGGLVIAPGSPYKSMAGALNAIRFARENKKPLLATCGGFQHVVIEYARNVLGVQDAAHEEYQLGRLEAEVRLGSPTPPEIVETCGLPLGRGQRPVPNTGGQRPAPNPDPYASKLFISRLSCSLVGKTMQVQLVPGSRATEIYGQDTATEQYYCNFGLNPAYQQLLHDGGLRVAGVDQDGEARILELPGHPFFIATLFLPQMNPAYDCLASGGAPHPLIGRFQQIVQASCGRGRASTELESK